MFDCEGRHLVHENDGTPVRFIASPHSSATFAPEGIILHDTAGRLYPKGGTANWFRNPKAKAAAHFNAERDGEINQCVELDRSAWHAGRSVYRGRPNVNRFAFGIEIVNPGKMTPTADGGGMAWFGKKFHDTDWQGKAQQGNYDLQRMSTPEHGDGMWMHYTEEQIQAVIEVCLALRETYPIKWISTHWYISPGRKVDVNPLFPLEHVRGVVFGRGDCDDQEDGKPFGDAQVVVNSNMREWPHYNSTVEQVLARDTRIDVIRSAHYPSGPDGQVEQWHLVDTGAKQGFVNALLVDLD